nr:hypothetical protein [Neisseria weixii]
MHWYRWQSDWQEPYRRSTCSRRIFTDGDIRIRPCGRCCGRTGSRAGTDGNTRSDLPGSSSLSICTARRQHQHRRQQDRTDGFHYTRTAVASAAAATDDLEDLPLAAAISATAV